MGCVVHRRSCNSPSQLGDSWLKAIDLYKVLLVQWSQNWTCGPQVDSTVPCHVAAYRPSASQHPISSDWISKSNHTHPVVKFLHPQATSPAFQRGQVRQDLTHLYPASNLPSTRELSSARCKTIWTLFHGSNCAQNTVFLMTLHSWFIKNVGWDMLRSRSLPRRKESIESSFFPHAIGVTAPSRGKRNAKVPSTKQLNSNPLGPTRAFVWLHHPTWISSWHPLPDVAIKTLPEISFLGYAIHVILASPMSGKSSNLPSKIWCARLTACIRHFWQSQKDTKSTKNLRNHLCHWGLRFPCS